MKRDEEKRANRIRFCQLAINNPLAATEQLHSMARSLYNCRTTSDRVYALSNIFGVSEKTIMRDLKEE